VLRVRAGGGGQIRKSRLRVSGRGRLRCGPVPGDRPSHSSPSIGSVSAAPMRSANCRCVLSRRWSRWC